MRGFDVRQPTFRHVGGGLEEVLLDIVILFGQHLELFVVFGQAHLFFGVPNWCCFLKKKICNFLDNFNFLNIVGLKWQLKPYNGIYFFITKKHTFKSTNNTKGRTKFQLVTRSGMDMIGLWKSDINP